MCYSCKWLLQVDDASLWANVVVFIGAIGPSKCIPVDRVGHTIAIQICGSHCDYFHSKAVSFWNFSCVVLRVEDWSIEVTLHIYSDSRKSLVISVL